MDINKILEQKNITKYKLSKLSGTPYTTVNDICSGKARIEKCSADTLYKLSKVLDVSMETLIEDTLEYRSAFETFKSNICHMVHDMGDINFIIDTLKSDEIRKLYQKKWYPESLYLLAMLDYLSRENELPICSEYNDIRKTQLNKPVYPSSVIALSAINKSDQPKKDSFDHAILEFRRFNIIENEVRNVF